ncbi:sodium:solute symporter family protein [Brevibacterium luteolum]|uniref:sodium:solute symporter family protein n=1 Tax=Brevibacterium luteolum TaxID=199591 RepID=UPI00223C2080|nr:sodium:solute symporter family protein [Brevibacterium luteolum]MCT1657177.1 sodium:solute symporter family protein [Brevibacterium luteolum]
MNPLWFVLALLAYFGVLIALSFYRRRADSGTDYFLGGRTMPAWMLAMAFAASWYGGNSALISIDAANEQGMGSWWVLGGPTVIAVVALIFIGPIIRRIGVLSQDGVMNMRYGRLTGTLLSLVMGIYMVVWGASQMVALGKFFAAFFGINFVLAVLIGIVVAIFYATIGGFRAVVLTETIQFGLLLLGLLITLVGALILSGGFEPVMERATTERPDDYFNLFAGFTPNIAFVVSFALAFLIEGAAWQRMQAGRTPRDARKTASYALSYFIPLYFLVVAAGIASIGVFPTVPENGVVATLAGERFWPIFGVLVFIGIAAAIMSTICTTLNLSSLYMTELYTKIKRNRVSDKQKVRVGMIGTVIASVLGFLIAIQLPEALILLGLASEILAAGMFFPMIMGMFWRRANQKGAVAGIIAGSGFTIYGFLVELGLPLPYFWPNDGPTRIFIGLGLSLIFYVAVSLMTKPDPERSDRFMHQSRKGTDESAEQIVRDHDAADDAAYEARNGRNGTGTGVTGTSGPGASAAGTTASGTDPGRD